MIKSILEKPISSLTLADCYKLVSLGYIITKSNDKILVRKGN